MAPSRDGHGLATEVSLAVPADTLDWWGARLTGYGATVAAIETRFGERALPLVDPHGLRVALVETPPAVGRGFTPWEASPVPVERQIRGLHGARVVERDPAATAAMLTQVLGFVPHATEGEWQRFVILAPALGDHRRRRRIPFRRLRTPPRRRTAARRRGAARGAPAASITSPGGSTTTRTRPRCAAASPTPARTRRR